MQDGNVNGHILRLNEEGTAPAEEGTAPAAESFSWDIYLFGAESGSEPTMVKLSGLKDEQDFSNPDGGSQTLRKSRRVLETVAEQHRVWAGKSPRSATVMITRDDGGRIGT